MRRPDSRQPLKQSNELLRKLENTAFIESVTRASNDDLAFDKAALMLRLGFPSPTALRG